MFKRYVYLEGLTNLLGSNGKYLINNAGQVKDIQGNDLPVHLDVDGQKVVNCIGFDGERNYRVIDLVAIQFKSIYIPEADFNKVIAFCIDGNKENTHASNVGYRFKGGKLECKKYPGYYYIPGYTYIVINEDGVGINHLKDKIIPWYTSKPNPAKKTVGGYKFAGIKFFTGVRVITSRHRALCLVFKDYPDNVDKLVINHLDGIPGNDNLDNLEWATYTRNINHAFENNMRSDNIPVLVRNVLTGEVKEYYSIGECSKALGYKGRTTINSRLYNSKFSEVFQEGTQVKLKSDVRDWIIPSDPEQSVKDARERISVICQCCSTGKVTTHGSITDLFKSIPGAKLGTVNSRLRLRDKSPYFGYQFKLDDDTEPFPPFSSQEYKKSFIPGRFTIDARNIVTGEVNTFISTRKAAEFINNSGILEKLREGEQPLVESGWQFKYAENEWDDVGDCEKALYNLQSQFTALEVATSRLYIADSAINLGIVLKLDTKKIRKAAATRGNMIYKGYRIRRGVSNAPWPDTTAA